MQFFQINEASANKEAQPANGIKYPEALMLMAISALIFWHCHEQPAAILLLLIGIAGGLWVSVYSYSRAVSVWSTGIVVAIGAIFVGSLQFEPSSALGLLTMIAIRVLKSPAAQRMTLVVIAITSLIVAFLLSTQVRPEGVNISSSWAASVILLLSLLSVIWQFWQVENELVSNRHITDHAQTRMTTMVAVISKLICFIPSQVWEPIVKNNSNIKVMNKRTKLSVLFSDIAGFTELSDTLSADNLADILNTYMDRMTVIANRHGATLDKFIGDGMVCFFGEPNSKGGRQDALDCVAMAIDMRREMRTLRHQWRLLGFEGLYIRIGIATGYCHVGNFGSENRMSYTLIGREVNLAARLEASANKGEILISPATYDYICHEYDCVQTSPLTLKGFESPVFAYQVLDPDANKGSQSKWVDHDLPGFNLHLNFKDIKNYDYPVIKQFLNQALERVDKQAGQETKSTEVSDLSIDFKNESHHEQW